MRTEEHIRSILRACIVGVCCVGVLTVVRVVSGDSLYIIDAGGVPRLQGPLGPGTLAFYCICISLLLYSYGTMSKTRNWVSIAIALTFGAVVTATGTRVAVAALLVSLMSVEWIRGRLRRGFMIGGVGLAIAIVLTPVLKRFAYSRDVRDLVGLDFGGGFWENLAVVDTSGRDMLWRRIWEDMVETRPLFGHGIGSANHYLTQMLGTPDGAVPHNEILRLLADTGVIGAVVGVTLWVMIARTVYQTPLPREDAYEFLKPLAFASFVSFLVCSLTDNTMEFYSVFTGYIAVFAGLLKVRSEQLAVPKSIPTSVTTASP